MEYVAGFAGISVTNAGHGNQKVVDAAVDQARKYVHACSYAYYAPPVGALAEKLAAVTPGRLQKTFFCNSGAEAIEGAIRLTRKFNGRRELMALESSFHGRAYYALSLTGNSARKKGGAPMREASRSRLRPTATGALRRRLPTSAICCAPGASPTSRGLTSRRICAPS